MKNKVAFACVAFAAALVAASPATAQTMLGSGGATCATLVDNDRFHTETPAMQWLLGYISAATRFGVVLSNGNDTQLSLNIDKLSNDQIVTWSKNWCAANRSRYLYEAASRFVTISGNI